MGAKRLRDDGGVRVLNRGYSAEEGEWSEAEGKAYFVGEPDIGFLRVSFFGPFYGAYGIFELDEDYEYAFVSGPTNKYLWLLARSPEVEPAVIEHFVSRAAELGFAVDELIMVEHD